MAKQHILSIDTAMSGCSASVHTEGGGSYTNSKPMSRGQAEHLVPMVQDVLAQAKAEFSDFASIITTIGPGAFTGLRIGLSTAKSLGLALKIPVFGITTLQALALQYAPKNTKNLPIMVLIETKRQDFYWQTFNQQGETISDASAGLANTIEEKIAGQPHLIIGDAVERFQSLMQDGASEHICETGFALPDTAFVARIFAESKGEGSVFHSVPAPVYLRAPDVSKSKKKQRVIAS